MTQVTKQPRILIVAVNWLGDLIFLTPAIRAIRRNYPNAYVACLVAPRGLDLLAGNPHLNSVIPLEEKRGLLGMTRWPIFIRFLKAQHFDTVFLFHRSFSRALMTWAAGIPSRIGYRTWKRGWLLTQAIDAPRPDSLHKAAYYLRLLEAAGLKTDGLRYEVGLLAEDHAKAKRLLAEWGVSSSERLVALHVGANWHLKRWPTGHFALLADRLHRECGAKVVLIGDREDLPLVQQVLEKARSRPIVAAGKTSFRELGALLTRTHLLVSNDSGPLHLGIAVGIPVVAIFGPTDPALSGPPREMVAASGCGTTPASSVVAGATLFGSIGCEVPCLQLRCPVNLCMEQVHVEQVLEAAKKFL